MKKAIIPLALLAMACLMVVAVAADCLRFEADARARVESADAELKKHEDRLARLLAGSPHVSPEMQAAIAAHEKAAGPRERHETYEQLVAQFRQTMSAAVDPTNPLDRKFMDDVAGSINRREVAQKQYDQELSAYRELMSGLRGRVARWFSSDADADHFDAAGAAPRSARFDLAASRTVSLPATRSAAVCITGTSGSMPRRSIGRSRNPVYALTG